MALLRNHAFVNPKADGADATIARPSDWNAPFVLSGATQGGIPWFTSATTEDTSALLAANKLMIGGGTAAPPSTLGSLGTTTTVLHGNAAGAPTFTAVVEADLNLTDVATANVSAAAHGFAPKFPNNTTTFLRGDGTYAAPTASVTWDTVGAAAGSATTANGTNNIVYNTAPTADSVAAWTFGETSAATNGTSTSGVPNQVLFKLATLAASTQSPLSVYSRGSHVFSVSPSTTQILAGTGTVYSFAASTNSGISFSGTLRLVVGGTNVVLISSTQVNVPIGSAGTPALTDSSNANIGFRWPSSHNMTVEDSSFGSLVTFTGGANTALMSIKAMAFANLGTPADGSMTYCSDCDAPTLIDSTCTSVGGKTGSFAARVNGAWKCFT